MKSFGLDENYISMRKYQGTEEKKEELRMEAHTIIQYIKKHVNHTSPKRCKRWGFCELKDGFRRES